jgi:iron complex outermembrane receptor protein
VEGEITSTEYFAELAVPLLKDIPAIKALDLELGYRFSDYNLSESADTYKYALKWEPFESLAGARVLQPCNPCA